MRVGEFFWVFLFFIGPMTIILIVITHSLRTFRINWQMQLLYIPPPEWKIKKYTGELECERAIEITKADQQTENK